MLTQKRLRQVLNYDPATGVFTFVVGSRKGQIAGSRHDARGFLKVSIDNHRYLLKRLAWLWMKGVMPRWTVEHINGDHGDNRWVNLRESDRGMKEKHRAPWPEPTSTPGVFKLKDRFEAMVPVGGVTINLGAFRTEAEAGKAIAAGHQRARTRARQQHRQAA
jgi:hypothetical protein